MGIGVERAWATDTCCEVQECHDLHGMGTSNTQGCDVAPHRSANRFLFFEMSMVGSIRDESRIVNISIAMLRFSDALNA